MRINLEDIKIKVKVVDQATLKAIVSLDFGDFVVKGFRVQKSKYKDEKTGEELWVTPPSYRATTGKYHPIFYIINKEEWEKLKQMIMDEYRSQTDEHYRKIYDLPKKEEETTDDEENFPKW